MISEAASINKKPSRQSTISQLVGKRDEESFFKNDIINSYAKYTTNDGYEDRGTMTQPVTEKL